MGSGALQFVKAVNRASFRIVVSFLIVVSGFQTCAAANKPEWVEVRSPNFIVITNANEQQARRTAHQFEMIRAVFRQYFGQKQTSNEQPVIILAAKDENTLKHLLPEYWANKGSAHPAGVYLSGTDTDYIALRLDVGLNQQAYEPYEPVYHEYVHYLTRRLIATMPLWMVEGIAEFYGNTRIESKKVFVGAPSTSNLLLLQKDPMLPVGTLFQIDASSPYYHEQNKTSIFYAESWALTHYLFAEDWKAHTQRMTDFVSLLQQGVDAKTAAAKTIGTAESLEGPLHKYVQNHLFVAETMEPPKIDENNFRMRPISDAEALAVRADFMGHDRHYSEAQQMLQEAVQADPKLGVAYEALAFIALQQAKPAKAEKWSAQAVALNPESYRANYYYAWSLMGEGLHDEETAAKAESCARTVIKNNPEFAPAYDAMAYILEMEGGQEKLDEAYMMTLQGLQREPGSLRFRLRAVEVLEHQGRAADALRVATLTVAMARTPEERQKAAAALESAQRFQESWEKMQARGNGEEENGVPTPRLTVRPDSGPASIPMERQVRASAGAMIVSDTQGVDFNPYLNQQVMPRIERNWMSEVMKFGDVAAVRKGTVIVEFAIGKDGVVGDLKVKSSSNMGVLDEAVRGAIEASSPFPSLPANFRGKNITIRFQCEYQGASAGAESKTTAREAGASSGSKPAAGEKGSEKSEKR